MTDTLTHSLAITQLSQFQAEEKVSQAERLKAIELQLLEEKIRLDVNKSFESERCFNHYINFQ